MARRPERGATLRRRRPRDEEQQQKRLFPRARRRRDQPRTSGPPAAPLLYLLRHGQAAVTAWQRALRAPVHSLLTAAVVAIALALPALLLLAVANAEQVAGSWQEGAPQASLFLERGTEAAELQRYADELRGRPGVQDVTGITPDEALSEFRAHSELDAALELLDENPLPPVLVVTLDRGLEPEAISELAASLAEGLPVARMQLDQQWVERLHALMTLAERALWAIAVLLALAVVLVIGNTIRLTLESRRHEIEIVKLIGGSNGFVRRPFLYEGLGYGLLGGVLAWVLTELIRWSLAGPVAQLASSYQSSFTLAGLGSAGGLGLLLMGAVLGTLGAWTAVARHLAAIELR